MTLKFFLGSKPIGFIENPVPDELAHVGDVALLPEAAAHAELFAFFNNDEKRWSAEPPFKQDLLEDWVVEDEQGSRNDIAVPPQASQCAHNTKRCSRNFD